MIGLLVRGLLILAGVLVSLFLSEDALNFGVFQMTVAVLLFVLVVFVLAFWPAHWSRKLNALKKPRAPRG